MFFEGITTHKACIKIELSRREWVLALLLVIFDDFGMIWIPHDQWLFTFFTTQQSFIFPQLKNTSENECNFSAEERTRKNEHGFSFLEAVKVHMTRISIFLQAKNAQTRTDSYCGKSNI